MQQSPLTQEQQAELDLLRDASGLLSPAAVVDFARNPNTALHARFTWDDGAAAEQWRLHEARNVIRVYVYVPEGSSEPIRAYVSLRNDRNADGGYRQIRDVLSDAELSEQLLEEALADLRVFRRKYQQLKALKSLFDEIAELEANHKAKRKPKRKVAAGV